MLEEGKNIILEKQNISNNQNEIKRFGSIEEISKFYKKSLKGLFFPPIFAFLFVAMLGFTYLVEKQKCDCDTQGGFNSCDCTGGGGGGEAGLGICALCIAAVLLFFLVIIYVIDVAIGQKVSRLAALFLQMAFAILYIVFGYLKGKEDGVYKFVLLTIIVGGITVFFNFVAMILIIIDIDTCTFFGLIKRHNEENEGNNNSNSYKSCSYQNDIKTSDQNTPNPPEVELKTSTDNNNSDSEQNNPEPNSGYDKNNGNINEGNEKEALISSSTQ
jgi:hypothetical protein